MQARRESGLALISTLLIMGLMLAVAMAVAMRVRLETLGQAAHHTAPQNLFTAEAGINRGVAEFRNIFLNGNVPTGNSASGTGDYAVRSATLATRSIRYQLREAGTNPNTVQLPLGQVPFGGLNSIQYRYAVTAATPDLGNPAAQLRSQFIANNIPIFQFAAFYNGRLEIAPGADMTLHGRVHSNADLYLDSTNHTLSIVDDPANGTNTVQVSAVGDLYRGRYDSNSCSGTVTIDQLQDANNDGRLDPANLACSGSTRLVPSSEIATWLGSITTHVPNIGLPPNFNISRLAADPSYWSRADLRIVLNLDQTYASGAGANAITLKQIEVENAAGAMDAAATAILRTFMANNRGKIFYNDIPYNTANVACTSSTSNGCDAAGVGSAARYQPPFAADNKVYRRADDGASFDPQWSAANDTRGALGDYRRGGFYSNREQKWLYVLSVDVQALLAWNRAQAAGNRLFDPDDTSDGGIVIFLSVVGGNSGGINNYAVRVFDSANLGFDVTGSDPTGLTVVSDQAIFVEGNYNSTVTTAGPGGLNHAPASIVGDSANVLSQNWEAAAANTGYLNDRKSRDTMPNRVPTTTTINAAFIAGVQPTVGGAYSGGLENYPRFHENWSGVAFNYRGSFVSLSVPSHVNGAWCGTGGTLASGCNIYNAPTRNWDYDQEYNDVAQLPPLTPRFIAIEQQVLTQDFR